MRYKAVFTDEFLSYFRLDDNGKTLVLTDKQGLTRAVTLDVEVEPRRGKWIKNEGRHGWHCSVCGKDNRFAFAWSVNSEIELQDFYCPNCGAKMDE